MKKLSDDAKLDCFNRCRSYLRRSLDLELNMSEACYLRRMIDESYLCAQDVSPRNMPNLAMEPVCKLLHRFYGLDPTEIFTSSIHWGFPQERFASIDLSFSSEFKEQFHKIRDEQYLP